MLLISCMKIFLFRVGTKLWDIGLVFEDLTFQGGVQKNIVSLTLYLVLVLPRPKGCQSWW